MDAGPEEAGEIEGRDAGRGTRPLGDPGRPVGINNGANGAASLANPLTAFCVLHGTHAPFDADKLASLYPTHGSYVSNVAKGMDELVDERFLLKEDAQTLLTDASQSGFGK
jgi:hypothetical protein